MPFPPPTQGYEGKYIGVSTEYLKPLPTVKAIYAPCNLDLAGISKGDVIMVEATIRPFNKSVSLIKKDGDSTLVRLHWQKGKWYAQNDTSSGRVTENLRYIALVRHVVKDQLV
ncbi:hypothetical protein [uncultured Photobacterium sp.]|uniref:hypothetical protein n=1 Tax=uncultured Photobacterium sp. TaxID=173973 RepID=UPI0026181756|nr:hypothetical protein [uncultured Photobacterium sp.]